MRNMPQVDDCNQRFLFDALDVRGECAHVSAAFQHINSVHQYPPGVTRLLGEFLAAAVLLASNIKFDGELILQARSAAQIPLLMVQCSSQREVRAIVRGAEQATASEFTQLLGGGTLAITIEPSNGQRYQGVVALQGSSLAEALQNYFEHSEQLTTGIWLASDGKHAAGMLLQQLPPQREHDAQARAEHWEHLHTLASTLKAEELLLLAPETLMHRLFHQEALRAFAPRAVVFACTCSRERIERALISLGSAELLSILNEQGSISADCEFCQ
jgi:molecular chaperone Hsp33